MKKIVMAGALGECVHVAGVSNFLRLAEIRRLANPFSRTCCIPECHVGRRPT